MRHAALFLMASAWLPVAMACTGGQTTAPSPAPASAPAATAPTTSTPQAELQSGPITFSGLSADRASVTSYSELGFTVTTTAASWQAFANYGNPRPSVIFQTPGGTTATGEIQVTGGGATFKFTAVDVYSSTTPIPYTITGLRGSAAVFTLAGTVANTFGQFRTVTSRDPAAVIDTLRITLTNVAAPCCNNPMGVDNITLMK